MDYSALIALLDDRGLAPVIDCLPGDFVEAFNHGDLPGWLKALDSLPAIEPDSWNIGDTVRIGSPGQCSDEQRRHIGELLLQLQPWRKGPFELFGLEIDSEWRSDWKWRRLAPHIAPLEGRKVLDVGSGNGYYCWRMAGAGAGLALGIDPHLLFSMQYHAIRRYLETPPAFVIPLALEAFPRNLQAFDTVFSMGVLYHRRSPIDHLLELKSCLRSGGELVLETLVVEGETGMTLMPRERYARMPNVWFLASCGTVESWLKRCGFTAVRLVDETVTTIDEQRKTPWIAAQSLSEALDPADPRFTIEGYPAPRRAVFIAEKN